MLSQLWPQSVPLWVDGRAYGMLPLRLRDLATLEALAGGGSSTFWFRLSMAESMADPEERGRALAKLLVDAQKLPEMGDPEVDAGMDHAGPRLKILDIVLRGNGLSLDAVADIALQLTDRQWRLADCIAWGINPLDAAAAALDHEAGIPGLPPRDEKPDWPDMVRKAMQAFPGLSLDAIGDMTLPQWSALMCEQEHPIAEPKPRRGWSIERIRDVILRPRAAFFKALGIDPLEKIKAKRNGKVHSETGTTT